MIQIIKRDGKKENFNCDKIEKAIQKAINEVYGVNDLQWPREIAQSICGRFTEGDITTVEEIQDLVEIELMKRDTKTAKAYIIYRNKRNELRNNPNWQLSELGKSIYENKYRLNGESFKDFLNRVSGGNKKIIKLMTDKALLPAGRILAGRGTHTTDTKVTLSNCYVLPSPEDNLESIFDTAKEMARTYSWGGGVGITLNKLRPNKAKVYNAAKTTSGPVSFMDLYDTTTSIIGQHNRRGALMIGMDCTHPDILEFINSKTDLAKATKANISVMISDDFMEAVLNNKKWELFFNVLDTNERISKEVDANQLFHTLCKNNWDYAEPGILFWDKIKKWNLLSEDKNFEFAGINPCGSL